MTGLDTNVLVRYIVRDDPAQTRLATALLEERCSAEDPGWINRVVLCELVWVLERGYGYERTRVASLIRQLLVIQELRVEQSDLAWSALGFYEAGPFDFADALIGLTNLHQGVKTTLTFDKQAGRLPDFTLLK